FRYVKSSGSEFPVSEFRRRAPLLRLQYPSRAGTSVRRTLPEVEHGKGRRFPCVSFFHPGDRIANRNHVSAAGSLSENAIVRIHRRLPADGAEVVKQPLRLAFQLEPHQWFKGAYRRDALLVRGMRVEPALLSKLLTDAHHPAGNGILARTDQFHIIVGKETGVPTLGYPQPRHCGRGI